jgi:hypothetical protein
MKRHPILARTARGLRLALTVPLAIVMGTAMLVAALGSRTRVA